MKITNQRPTYRISDLAPSERPRERLEQHGPGALSIAELLAILLQTGIPGENAVEMGTRLLKTYEGLTGLHRATFEQLLQERGLGPAKASQLKAALELGYRLQSENPEERPAIHSPDDAAGLVQYQMSALEQEELRVILLNTRNQVIKIETIYRGSLNSSQVRIGELFKTAIRNNAAATIVAHNHPSGDPTPSPDDVAITRAIVQAGKLLDIEVLDHLVIGGNKYVSLKNRGLGFS